MAKQVEKKPFYVHQEGWVLGQYRTVGEEVRATDEEAKYLLSAGNIGPEKLTAGEKRKAERMAASEAEAAASPTG